MRWLAYLSHKMGCFRLVPISALQKNVWWKYPQAVPTRIGHGISAHNLRVTWLYIGRYLMSELASSTAVTQLFKMHCLVSFSPAPVNIFIGSAITVTQCISLNCANFTTGFLWWQLAITLTVYTGEILITILSSAQLASMRTFWFLSAVRYISPITMLSNVYMGGNIMYGLLQLNNHKTCGYYV